MNGSRRFLPLFVLLIAAGCQGSRSYQRSLASTEPGLLSSDGSTTTIVEGPPTEAITFVDRHPIFSKPRDYYTGPGNKAVNAAKATVIGIPAGAVGEVKQLFVRKPPTIVY